MVAVDPFNLPFPQAIDYFRQKTAIPSETYASVIDELNDWAFSVAGVTDAQMLADFYQAVDDAIVSGSTYEEFEQRYSDIAQANGWTPQEGISRRARLAFSTNLRSAWAAGRYSQMQTPYMLQARPYWQWRHRDSPNPRPAHLALDGKIFSATSNFWATCAPPCGHGCRCSLFALRSLPAGQDAADQPPAETANLTDPITGQTQTVPAMRLDSGQVVPISDIGFNYMPGQTPASQRQQLLANTIARLPAPLQAQAQAAIQQAPTFSLSNFSLYVKSEKTGSRIEFGTRSDRKSCFKGYACGYSCIPQGRRCRNTLDGTEAALAEAIKSLRHVVK